MCGWKARRSGARPADAQARSTFAASAATGAFGWTAAHKAPPLRRSKMPAPATADRNGRSGCGRARGDVVGQRPFDFADEAQGEMQLLVADPAQLGESSIASISRSRMSARAGGWRRTGGASRVALAPGAGHFEASRRILRPHRRHLLFVIAFVGKSDILAIRCVKGVSMKMPGPVRSLASAAVAMSLAASSIASAAPAVSGPTNPLVTLSVFGSAQSRAALCAAGSAAVAAAGTASAAQAAQPAPGCVLPIADTAPPPPVASSVLGEAAPVAPYVPAAAGPNCGRCSPASACSARSSSCSTTPFSATTTMRADCHRRGQPSLKPRTRRSVAGRIPVFP